MTRPWRTRYSRPLLAAFLISFSVVLYLSFDFYASPLRALVTLDPHPSEPSKIQPHFPHPSTYPISRLNDTIHDEVEHTNPPPRILLVSAFFPLSKSKHSLSDYESWLRRFLSTVHTDLYFFCPPDPTIVSLIRTFRGNFPIVIDTTYGSPFDVPPLQGMGGEGGRYQEMHEWDREAFRHSGELYAVWNAKPWFLEYALKNGGVSGPMRNGSAYDYAFWTDAGAMREDNDELYGLGTWPDPRRVQEVFEMGRRDLARVNELETTAKKEDEKLIFFPVWNVPDEKFEYWAEDMGPVDIDFSEGSFFGGTPSSIAWYTRTFYAYHDHYLSQSIFVGKDQTLINALFLLFPSHFFGVSLWSASVTSPLAIAHNHIPKNTETPLGTCGNSWYYYMWWLADETTKDEIAETWLVEAERKDSITASEGWWRWHSIWRLKDWWRSSPRVRCVEGEPFGMKGMLERQFGSEWRAPVRTIRIET